jgi:hypothetical protein
MTPNCNFKTHYTSTNNLILGDLVLLTPMMARVYDFDHNSLCVYLGSGKSKISWVECPIYRFVMKDKIREFLLMDVFLVETDYNLPYEKRNKS